MTVPPRVLLHALMFNVLMFTTSAEAAATTRKPHLVYFLADDFGHYDVSWLNPKAHTPHMDALAAAGIKLGRFYTYKFCSPTRSSFLSGR
eukprot:gene5324-32511_t